MLNLSRLKINFHSCFILFFHIRRDYRIEISDFLRLLSIRVEDEILSHNVDSIVCIVVQRKPESHEMLNFYMLSLWLGAIVICAVVLILLQYEMGFQLPVISEAFLNAYSVFFGGTPTPAKTRPVLIFMLFLSIFSLLFNIQYTDQLFGKLVGGDGNRIETVAELSKLDVSYYLDITCIIYSSHFKDILRFVASKIAPY